MSLLGHVSVQGYSGGAVIIDVFDGDHRDHTQNKHIQLVTRVEIETPGDFELLLPETGKYWLSAYNDVDGDGRPTRVEPFVEYDGNPVIATRLPERVVLELSTSDPNGSAK